MKRLLARLGLLLGVSLALASGACGSRSELPPGASSAGSAGTGGMPPMGCSSDVECGDSDACVARRCVDGVCTSETTNCDDGDACSEDSCDVTAGCVHRPATVDADGDGFKGPRPGFAPGAPEACGNDCDDRSAAAFPGNKEMCDGVDNDCNGVVDDGTTYVASKMTPVRVSTPKAVYAFRNGGIVGVPDGFVFAYTGHLPLAGNATRSKPHGLLKGVRADGSSLFETEASDVNAPTFGGSLAWSGDVLAAAWNDTRVDGNYEVYLGRFTGQGQKLGPDQRVSDAPGFSKSPYVVWNRSEFVLTWDDSRKEGRVSGNRVAIYGQRAAADGTLLGQSVAIVDDGMVNEGPFTALGSERIGLVYSIAPPAGIGNTGLGFRVLNANLALVGVPPEPLGFDVQSPTVHFVGDRFVVLWDVASSVPGDAIWGAVFDQQGRLLSSPSPVTSGARFARMHDAISLGDRLIMIWSDDHDGNYEVYWEVLTPDLALLEPRQRLTFNTTDSKNPTLAAGPGGKIGVVFEDEFEGTRQVYFTTLECGARTQ